MSVYVPPRRPQPYGAIYTPPAPEPEKEPESMPLPNDEQAVNAMRRIHIEGYMGELRRERGIFDVPGGSAHSQIRDPRQPETAIDDFSLSVWFARYVRYFADTARGADPHERAIRLVLQDLHNSDEARQKRGEQPPPVPPPSGTLRGPISVSGRDFEVPS